MPTKAVQQFMLGTVLSNENEARQTLAAMKAAGYDGIELCGFMIHPIGFMVRLLTKAAGMPVGKGGNLDWHALVKEAGLQVVSLHTDLGSLERDAKAVADEAKSFGTTAPASAFCTPPSVSKPRWRGPSSFRGWRHTGWGPAAGLPA